MVEVSIGDQRDAQSMTHQLSALLHITAAVHVESSAVPPTLSFGVCCSNALPNGAYVLHLGITCCDDACALLVGLW